MSEQDHSILSPISPPFTANLSEEECIDEISSEHEEISLKFNELLANIIDSDTDSTSINSEDFEEEVEEQEVGDEIDDIFRYGICTINGLESGRHIGWEFGLEILIYNEILYLQLDPSMQVPQDQITQQQLHIFLPQLQPIHNWKKNYAIVVLLRFHIMLTVILRMYVMFTSDLMRRWKHLA